ncbi:DUF2809 domain-containing protein [Pseudomonas aeruginosa]|uniref:DUF2809 domain-containing protein n=1 Tax=Pseudomonas aeruginosa TaxID=287 RepID=UPI003261C926
MRSFGGDLLAVVWLYYLMGSALRAPAAWLASAAFAVGALLELGQYLLVLLATLGRHWGWIRSFGGDLLAVVWLYYLMGSALRAPAAWLASAAFAVGALLELGQYLAAQLHWQFSSPVLRIVLGSTADGFDLLAYALGALLAWWLERRR